MNNNNLETTAANDDAIGDVDVLAEKLKDAMVPGVVVELDPNEAERIGAFEEDALSEADAKESVIDLDSIG